MNGDSPIISNYNYASTCTCRTLFLHPSIFFFQGVMIATTGGVFCALNNKMANKSGVICAGLCDCNS